MQFQCSGVRCKTKYLSLDQYTNSNLLSDYKFLEDVDRFVYTAAHDSHSKNRRQNSQILHLRRKAKQSGVNLRLMPVGMSKRKENTSTFSRKEKCIMWRIQWLFPQAGTEYVDRWVSELAIVRDVLKKYIDPEHADAVHKQSLKNYCEVGPHRVCVFLKKELLPGTEVRYHQLDISQTLKDCLAHKTIIEFPTLHVVLPDKTAGYISESLDT
ncbi:box C/D snoRNA protein 1-like isoform X2 [Oculina patagonica]